MSVTKKLFARVPGEAVTQYTLTNANQMAVRLLTFGARVQQVRLPNKQGADPNLIVGFVTLQDYLNQPEPFGALLGPDWQAPTHNDWQNWNWDATTDDDSVTFSLRLPESADGRPGTQTITVTHTLDDDNCWTSRLKLTSDTPLMIRPTQNLAFMLTGDPAAEIHDESLTLGEGAASAPAATLTAATTARLEDHDWRLDFATDAAGLAVSTFSHLDDTTNFNGILGHPDAAVGLRPLMTEADQLLRIDAAHPFALTTWVTLQAR